MALMGKIVGGAVGFVLGGPIGAIAGAIVGHGFDAGGEKHYAILGCVRSDSNERIKKQYRKLVVEYHPDKIASKGLPEERVRYASDRFYEIQEAYNTVKKERSL